MISIAYPGAKFFLWKTSDIGANLQNNHSSESGEKYWVNYERKVGFTIEKEISNFKTTMTASRHTLIFNAF